MLPCEELLNIIILYNVIGNIFRIEIIIYKKKKN